MSRLGCSSPSERYHRLKAKEYYRKQVRKGGNKHRSGKELSRGIELDFQRSNSCKSMHQSIPIRNVFNEEENGL